MAEPRRNDSECATNHSGDVEINMDRNRCSEMKHDTLRRFGSSRRNLMFVFVILATGGLLGSLFLSLNINKRSSEDNDEFSEDKINSRTKRQSGTCHVDMCLTQECVHAASAILQFMDASADPCDDFYQYTCGGWIKENKHKTGIDDLFYAVNHNTLPEKIDLTLSELLKQNLPIPEEMMETKPYQNLFSFYDSCMLLSQMPENDMTEAIEVLKGLKHFQIGRPFDRESWDLTKALLELMRINGAPLVDVIIQSDVQRPDKYCINITPPRRYGLIPNLIGPKLRNPFVEQYFSVKGRRRALLGDLSDDIFMSKLLSALDVGEFAGTKSAHKDFDGASMSVSAERGPMPRRRESDQGSFSGKPLLNILPTDDTLEKTSFTINDPLDNAPQTTLTPRPVTTTTTSSTTEKPTTTSQSPTTEFETTLRPRSSSMTPSTQSLPSSGLPDGTTTTTTTSTTASPLEPTAITSSPRFVSTSTEDMIPEPTMLGPASSASVTTESPEYESEIEEDYPENVRKVVSRKAVFKLFKRNLDKKRTEAIGTMVQNTFSNVSDEILTSAFGNFQPYDVYSAVIDHFVPLLDEIQPTEQEELRAQQHSKLFNHFTLDQLQELAPVIDWKYLLSELFEKNINEEDNIYVFHPAYMTQLSLLISALDPWVIHYGMLALYAYDVLREAAIAPAGMDREDFCLQASKNVFGDAMSHMYLHHVGNKTIHDLRRHTASILENLREEVKLSLRMTPWLTKEDRDVALNKINFLRAEVGAYDKHWDIAYVNESHESITINSEETFLGNVMEIYRTFRKELYDIYHKPVDKDMLIWSFTVQPFIVNAFHMQTTNSIVFPEAFFQKPYYSPKAPEYINYGSAGTSMAHEIFHGLDFTGTLFDHMGAMNRPFSNVTWYRLRETVECYHRLLTDTFYEEVPVEQTLIAMEIDSSATLNENLADIGGIRHAFRAYQRWENQNYREPRLPALTLNPYQLFFVSAVRPYCAVIPNLAKIFLMEMDEHLPNGMRMNAMLMNTPEFAQVFNCSPGSRMVAPKTCPIF